MYHTDAAHVGDGTDTHKKGDIMVHTSHTPVIGDITYSSPCTCFLYGMCPVLPVSEGWERIVGEAKGKGDEERRVDEVGQPPDYIYHYPPSGYLPFPHVHTASPHPTPAAAPTAPIILVSPSPSSPPPTTAPSTPIPYTVTSLKNEEEPQEGSDTVHNVTTPYEETNGQCPSSPPPPPPPAAPQHIPSNSTYAQPFMEENKVGVYGADCCWYSLAATHNGSGAEHLSTITSSPHKASVYLPCIHPDSAVLLPPPHDPATLIPSSHDPISYIPTATVVSSTSSSSSSSSPFTHSSLLNGKNELSQNGVLYYNYFQHLNLPVDVFGKPRLLTSVKKEGKM